MVAIMITMILIIEKALEKTQLIFNLGNVRSDTSSTYI